MKTEKNIIKTAKIFRDIIGNSLFIRIIDSFAVSVFNLLQHKKKELYPNIFIIGPPGSGTTIIYQLLIKEFRFAYFSNLTNAIYGLPFLISYITKNKILKSDFDLKSHHGYIKGIHSPSEMASLNGYWFDKTSKNIAYKKLKAVNKLYAKPVVIKNTQNTLRVNQIHSVLPNSLFIYVSRNKYFNAQSIYLNKENYKHIDRFYSKAFEVNVNNDYLKKAIEIIDYSDQIKNYLKKYMSENIIELSYEDFIKDPEPGFTCISDWYNKRGINLNRTYFVKKVELKLKNINKLDNSKSNYLINLIKQNFK